MILKLTLSLRNSGMNTTVARNEKPSLCDSEVDTIVARLGYGWHRCTIRQWIPPLDDSDMDFAVVRFGYRFYRFTIRLWIPPLCAIFIQMNYSYKYILR